MPVTEIVSTSDHPGLQRAAAAAFREGRPTFVLHDPVSNAYLWMRHV